MAGMSRPMFKLPLYGQDRERRDFAPCRWPV